MQLESYLKINNFKPCVWAVDNGISVSSLHRYLKGIGTIDARNILKIERATFEQVTVKEIVERYKSKLD